MNIENIMKASAFEANEVISRGVQEAIAEIVRQKFEEQGLLLSPNWDMAEGKRGIHLYLPFGTESMDLPIFNPLRDYQEEALEVLKKLVQDQLYVDNEHYRKTIINLPTGSGKTRIFLELLAWWKSFDITVIAAPTISLLRQIEQNTKKFMEEHNCHYEYKVVSSDRKLSDDEIENEEDQLILDMMLQHGEATTNVDEIQSTIANRSKKLVIFATYRSLTKIADAANNLGVTLDLLVADEGHRMCDKTANENLEHDTFKYMSFFTATVREKVSNTDNFLDYPMTNKDYFGPIGYKKTARELIDAGYILEPKLLAIDWNDEYTEVISKALDNRELEISDDVKHEFALYVAGLLHVYQQTGKMKNIAFVQSISVADWYLRNFNIITNIMSEIVGHDINMKAFVISQRIEGFDRVKMLREFDLCENAVMFNYQVIKEGIDINDCNSVAWMRKMDCVGLTQSMGRAMRVDPNDANKKYGYVLCPINIDHHDKGAIIERMKNIARTLIDMGFSDMIVDRLNNSDRQQGDGSGQRRDIREIDFGALTPEEILKLCENIEIKDGDAIIKPDYYITDKEFEESEEFFNILNEFK